MGVSVRGFGWCRAALVCAGCVVALAALPAVASAASGWAPVESMGTAGAPASTASKPKLRKPKRHSISQLYVLNAAHGTLRHGAHGRLVLRLRGLERHAVWFADRPARRSGSFPSAAFASSWKGFGFAADPPSAALDYTHAGRERTAMLKLSHPRYAKHKHTRVLSFRARLLDPHKVKDPNLASHARAADRRPAHHFAAASLFVAEDSAPVINGCTIQSQTNCYGADLYGADLEGADLYGANLATANLSYANLKDADLEEADFNGANLSYAILIEAYAKFAIITNANLTGANGGNANFYQVGFQNSNLTNDLLNDADLKYDNFYNVNFTGADLTGAKTFGASFDKATFCNTVMSDGSLNPGDC